MIPRNVHGYDGLDVGLLLPRARKVRQRPEEVVQKAVVEHWRLRGTPFSIVVGHLTGDKSKMRRIKAHAMGAMAGMPDLLVGVPGLPLLGLELKVKYANGKKNTPSAAQKDVRQRFRAIGWDYLVATGIDEALAILIERGAIR